MLLEELLISCSMAGKMIRQEMQSQCTGRYKPNNTSLVNAAAFYKLTLLDPKLLLCLDAAQVMSSLYNLVVWVVLCSYMPLGWCRIIEKHMLGAKFHFSPAALSNFCITLNAQ